MFDKTARYYDALYAQKKDYAADAKQLRAWIASHGRADGNALLDLACGTGLHLALLRDDFEVEGADLDAGLLEVARERLPGVPLHQADMKDFDLGHRFDVITCLFSSVGYLASVEELRSMSACCFEHLHPGGLLVLEPWLEPGVLRLGEAHMLVVDEPELKICRMNVIDIEGDVSIVYFHYLIGTGDGIEHCTEQHRMMLFTREQTTTALETAGFEVTHDEEGLMGRGMYFAVRPTSETT